MLTDLIMPGVDGKLIDEIKILSPQTPAILLSGKVRIYDRDTRADIFLPKGMYTPLESTGTHPGDAGPQARPQACAGPGAIRRSCRRSLREVQESLRHAEHPFTGSLRLPENIPQA